jgi:hypothetical protein
MERMKLALAIPRNMASERKETFSLEPTDLSPN